MKPPEGYALTKTRTRYRRLEAGEALIPGDEYRMKGSHLTDGRKISTNWTRVRFITIPESMFQSRMYEYRRPVPYTPTAEDRIVMRVATAFLAIHTNPKQ